MNGDAATVRYSGGSLPGKVGEYRLRLYSEHPTAAADCTGKFSQKRPGTAPEFYRVVTGT